MKKKCVKAMALALTLAMIPVMAYGASSSPTNDDYDSSSSAAPQTNQNTSVGGNGTSGTSISTSNQPSLEISSNGDKTYVAQQSKDKANVTQSIVVNEANQDGQNASVGSTGRVEIGDAVVFFAVDNAETAGLPQNVVDEINKLNQSKDGSEVFPEQQNTGYQKLGNTRALVLQSKSTGKADPGAVEITIKVNEMDSNTQSLVIKYYDNTTGKWVTIIPTFNAKTKKVTFKAPASGTYQIFWK